MKTPRKRALKKVICFFLSAIISLFIIRYLFVDVYSIPSESMKNKFKTDDYIFINKTFYSGIFSSFNTKLNIGVKPHRNDIFVFTIHKDIPGFFVKRCVGLPGSVIEIKNGTVHVDGKAIVEPLSVRHYYKIWFNDYQQTKADIEKAGIDKLENGFRRFPGYVLLALDYLQKGQLKNGIDSITIYNAKNDLDSSRINLPELNENILDMDLLRIPFKGMTIFFDQHIPPAYESAIRTYEDSTFRLDGKQALIAGKQVTSYSFKRDYFFMLGDNRDIAIDSRHYGLIPKKNLIGKYMFKL